jgi:4-amino-4-deoxy-L-arabinose transferase-like glycosyltransferase
MTSLRRRTRALGLLLLGLSLFVVLTVSARTGPSFPELARLEAITRASDVVIEVARSGPSALVAAPARSVYAKLDSGGTLPVLLGAWARLSVGRIGLLDGLTASRLPWLLLAALVPYLVYLLVEPSRGPRVALTAGLLALVLPRFIHGAAVTTPGVTASATWLLVAVLSLRTLGAGARRMSAWAIAASAALGVGVAVTWSALWVLPLLTLHLWLARPRAFRRLMRRGRLPLPAFALPALLVTPMVLLVFDPGLWTANPVAAVRAMLRPLAPRIEPTIYAGRLVEQLPAPKSYALSFVMQTLPAVVLVALLLGLVLIVHRALGRRFAAGCLRPAADRRALGAFVVIGLVVTLFGPALAPPPLVTFPPPVEAALPFVAIAAAFGVDAAARKAAGRYAWLVTAFIIAVVAHLALRAPSTGGASFNVLLGGAARVVQSRALPIGDGSEVAALAEPLDALGRAQISLLAPEVPPALWRVLRDARRLRTVVVSSAERDGLALIRGEGHGDVVARVEREGAVLWTLVRR